MTDREECYDASIYNFFTLRTRFISDMPIAGRRMKYRHKRIYFKTLPSLLLPFELDKLSKISLLFLSNFSPFFGWLLRKIFKEVDDEDLHLCTYITTTAKREDKEKQKYIYICRFRVPNIRGKKYFCQNEETYVCILYIKIDAHITSCYIIFWREIILFLFHSVLTQKNKDSWRNLVAVAAMVVVVVEMKKV